MSLTYDKDDQSYFVTLFFKKTNVPKPWKQMSPWISESLDPLLFLIGSESFIHCSFSCFHIVTHWRKVALMFFGTDVHASLYALAHNFHNYLLMSLTKLNAFMYQQWSFFQRDNLLLSPFWYKIKFLHSLHFSFICHLPVWLLTLISHNLTTYYSGSYQATSEQCILENGVLKTAEKINAGYDRKVSDLSEANIRHVVLM